MKGKRVQADEVESEGGGEGTAAGRLGEGGEGAEQEEERLKRQRDGLRVKMGEERQVQRVGGSGQASPGAAMATALAGGCGQ
jgi:hypothetical protein